MPLTIHSRPSAQELVDDYAVINRGWNANLHFDDGDLRFWLHRTGVADGEPYENTISIEQLVDGRWETIEPGYDGGPIGDADFERRRKIAGQIMIEVLAQLEEPSDETSALFEDDEDDALAKDLRECLLASIEQRYSDWLCDNDLGEP